MSDRKSMGTREAAICRELSREALSFRKRLLGLADAAPEESGDRQGTSRTGFAELRLMRMYGDVDADDDDVDAAGNDDTGPVISRHHGGYPPDPVRIAASIMLAREVDRCSSLAEELSAGCPVVVIDIPDAQMLETLKDTWGRISFGFDRRLTDVEKSIAGPRERHGGFYLFRREPAKATTKVALERSILELLPFALPIVAISPAASSHVPTCLLAAATHRITVAKPDISVIESTIRIVTGKPVRGELEAEIASGLTTVDLAIAIRFDRTPAQCVVELRRLLALRASKRSSREIALDDLHGMPAARAWAAAALSDLAAWNRGEANWEAVASSAVLVGPPGTGKSLFCEAFARQVGPLIPCSYARWQSDGDGHLGHTLRAMARDFQAAREQAPSVILIDEIDSFPDRASVNHSHRDYVRSVGNALLEEIEGVRKREGVFVLGCTNAIETCDPALLRAGRLETIIRIPLPGPTDLERIFRVKLGRDLSDEPLRPFAELAAGMTGADVEKIVDDARRAARREKRSLETADLRNALVGDDVPEQLRWRTAVHEAGHILAEVVLFGSGDVFATTTATRHRLGVSVRTQTTILEGTAREYRSRLVVLLAGRGAEQAVIGEASQGGSADIEAATTLACSLHGSLGLAGPTPLVYLGPSRDAREFLRYADVRESVAAELADAEQMCRELLQTKHSALIAVARRLFKMGRIDGREVERIVGQRSPSSSTTISLPS